MPYFLKRKLAPPTLSSQRHLYAQLARDYNLATSNNFFSRQYFLVSFLFLSLGTNKPVYIFELNTSYSFPLMHQIIEKQCRPIDSCIVTIHMCVYVYLYTFVITYLLHILFSFTVLWQWIYLI